MNTNNEIESKNNQFPCIPNLFADLGLGHTLNI